jgi:drug/metabolite transporter (DMT)-like permease
MGIMNKTYLNYLLLFLLALIWGSSFILMKKALIIYSDTQVAALRLLIAFIALSPFIIRAFSKVQKKHFFPIILTAFFGNGIPAFLFTKAQTVLDSSLVGILNSLTPLFTLLLAVLFFKNKIKPINIAGILLGLIGAVYLNIVLSNFEFQLNFYALLIVLATLFYAISVNIIKNYLYDLDSVSIASLAFLVLGPFSAIYLFFTDFTQIYNSEKGIEALFYVIILSVIGTALALIIFNKLIKRTSVVFASSVTYLIPIVAILWGVFDGEEISMQFYAGTLIILLAIFMVNKKVK